MAAREALSNLFRVLVIGLVACTVVWTAWPPTSASAAGSSANLYVSVNGSNANTGATSAAPLATIQAALDRAAPGMTIHLAPGVYHETPTTKLNGTAQAPITIEGSETGTAASGRFKTLIEGKGRIFNINNSYYTLSGFTIDGEEALRSAIWPTTLSAVRAFKDKVQPQVVDSRLIYVGSADTARGITGVHIDNMFLHGAGGECVRLRSNANHNEISNSTIEFCGLLGKGDDVSTYKYHNAEGVYVGSSPSDPSQPLYANDTSSYNLITDNVIQTFGSECVDVKENSHDNVVSSNVCKNNDEPGSFEGSNVEIRGFHNSVTNNVLSGSRGFGIKLGTDGPQFKSSGNVISGNALSVDANFSLLNKNTSAQGVACGNHFDSTRVLEGTSLGNLSAACAPTPPPSTTPPVKAPAATPASPVQLEAENGSRTGSMVRISRSDARGGWYLTQGSKDIATATYSFSIAKAGSYALSARVIAPNLSSDSVYFAFDRSAPVAWGFRQHLGTWSWFQAAGSVFLSAGTHTLVITGREPGTMLDAFQIAPVSSN